jgi:hypothetical protein
MKIYTIKSRQLIATGYERLVVGKRGKYYEFTFDQLVKENLFIPTCQAWRIHSPDAYYIEYRTTQDNVMVYHQKMCVTYADYKIGFCYIAPADITLPK